VCVCKVVIEPNIECSSAIHLIFFGTQVELKLIIELDNMFKLGSGSFIF
jgi:hypothetical protein